MRARLGSIWKKMEQLQHHHELWTTTHNAAESRAAANPIRLF